MRKNEHSNSSYFHKLKMRKFKTLNDDIDDGRSTRMAVSGFACSGLLTGNVVFILAPWIIAGNL